MNPIAVFASSLIIGYFVLTMTGTSVTKEKIKENNVAKRIEQKAQSLKEMVAIENMDKSSVLLGTDDVAASKRRISHMLVPSLNTSKYHEILLDKHFRATLKVFETATTFNKPDCSQLEATGLITLHECNYIAGKDLKFYNYDEAKGKVEYEVEKKISTKTSALSKNTTTSTIDANYDKIENFDNTEYENELEEKRFAITNSLSNRIEKLVLQGKIDLAKNLNTKLNRVNSIRAEEYKTKYGW